MIYCFKYNRSLIVVLSEQLSESRVEYGEEGGFCNGEVIGFWGM